MKKIQIPFNNDIGLLILRVGLGLSMAANHGYGKIIGGPEKWAKTGAMMPSLGLEFMPLVWGFMASLAEFACAILVIFGILFRPALSLLIATMTVAAFVHLNMPADSPRSGISGASHALEFLVAFLALYATGPGKYRLKIGSV